MRYVVAALGRHKASGKHHGAVPYQEAPAALAYVRKSKTYADKKLALELLILTATRTIEVRGARWSEFDKESASWTIPASRMKGKREHRVPLSLAALNVLQAAYVHGGGFGSDLVFPNSKDGGTISNDGLRQLIVRRYPDFKHTPPSETAAAPTQFSRAMSEIGVQLIFARSPQAKGRVERTAGTLQDRLVTEMRLAGATTIDDANRVLNDFLPRFNERFRVPPENADTTYRVPDPGMCLDTILCLKYRRRVGRDNTVKYRWRTLQLLPDKSRPSYAGSVVEVLEGLDGRLAVQHEGRTVASQQAPPRPSVLRSFDTRTVHTAGPSRYTNGVTRRSEDAVASMGTMLVVDRLRDDADHNGAARVRRTATPRSRKPTPLQTARWKAVQKAKRKGLSIRGIARELSIHRDTVRKYMNAESPPMSPARATSAVP